MSSAAKDIKVYLDEGFRLSQLAQYAAAQAQYEVALKTVEDFWGRDHIAIASVLLLLAICFENHGRVNSPKLSSCICAA